MHLTRREAILLALTGYGLILLLGWHSWLAPLLSERDALQERCQLLEQQSGAVDTSNAVITTVPDAEALLAALPLQPETSALLTMLGNEAETSGCTILALHCSAADTSQLDPALDQGLPVLGIELELSGTTQQLATLLNRLAGSERLLYIQQLNWTAFPPDPQHQLTLTLYAWYGLAPL